MAFIDHYLYILSLGRVAAIDKKTGDIKWEVNLKDIASISSMGYSIGQIVLEGDKLFIGGSGILICLNAKDGALLWKNELKGWGYNFVSIANSSSIEASQELANAATIATIT
ncbi:MAG TPA: PQQ-binding-like beta-propeller repeat protein [Niabella sp.]|nr:PQQ-binding-like beta-propeller repeat protein [Niabella sp.]HOZ97983.1 PQQ-binding-like beta-propeller repeat protein [Niabella sp.]HQW14133.1 PQQ-binding-like beta-propeller repeat protein [Niabella sp.]HQX19531.1 PQQ-binding-like beta-propeller repeat protein [Niabella sp.]HQX40033.1 PQQ-binding-like beta-propeller repeat protein [Niabella sp.]